MYAQPKLKSIVSMYRKLFQRRKKNTHLQKESALTRLGHRYNNDDSSHKKPHCTRVSVHCLPTNAPLLKLLNKKTDTDTD